MKKCREDLWFGNSIRPCELVLRKNGKHILEINFKETVKCSPLLCRKHREFLITLTWIIYTKWLIWLIIRLIRLFPSVTFIRLRRKTISSMNDLSLLNIYLYKVLLQYFCWHGYAFLMLCEIYLIFSFLVLSTCEKMAFFP